MIMKLIDWYLARQGQRRVATSSVLLEITKAVQDLAVAALPLIAQEDKKPFRGEYKRRQVYSRLVRAFPAAQKIDAALAVEFAIRMARGLL